MNVPKIFTMLRYLLLLCVAITIAFYSRCKASIGESYKTRRRIIYHAVNNCHPKLRGTNQIIVEPLPRKSPHKDIPIPGILITQIPLDENILLQVEFWRCSRIRGYERIPIEFEVFGCSEAKRFFGLQWKNLFREHHRLECPIPKGAYRINEEVVDKVLRNREDVILTPNLLFTRYRIRVRFLNLTTYDDPYGCIYGDMNFKPVYHNQVRRLDVQI